MPVGHRETATGSAEAGEVGQTVRVGESKEDPALMGVSTLGDAERQPGMSDYVPLIRPMGLAKVLKEGNGTEETVD